MKQWYEEFFENYAESYDKQSFTRGTQGEGYFIEKEINFDKTKRILDIGCGTGRDAILKVFQIIRPLPMLPNKP